jgi:hypothetical protein
VAASLFYKKTCEHPHVRRNSLAEEFETANLVHEKLDQLIHRDTKEDVRRYLEEAGFEIRN